ncbi:MAG: alpha/beta hydrolase family protein [Bradymonadia bacterium]
MIRHQIGFLALILSISACSKGSGRSVSTNDAMHPIGDTAIVSTDSEVADAGMPPTADGGPQPTADAGPDSPVVGFIADTLTYRPIGYADDRTLPVYLWYRGARKTDTPAIHLFLNPENAYEDAQPVDQDPAPLIVFSHGRRGFGAYSYFIAEYFALQGFIVAAMDHTGERIADPIPPEDIYSLRPQDLSALIDHALNLPDDHPLSGSTDGRVIAVGHSIGGYTVFAATGAQYDLDFWTATCADGSDDTFCPNLATEGERFAHGYADPRIDVAIPIAPGDYDLYRGGLNTLQCPTLLITGERDQNTGFNGQNEQIWDDFEGVEHRRVSFTTAGHFSFTNLCDFIGSLGTDDGCGEMNLPVSEAHAVTLEYMHAFIRRHLFSDESDAALLDGQLSLRDDVRLMKKD